MNRSFDRCARVVLASLAIVGGGCADAGAPPNGATADDSMKAPPRAGAPAADAAAPPPAPGPGTPAGPGCAFETRSQFITTGNVVESITANGKLFNFESNGAPWNSNGIDLTDIPGYASGPCRGKGRGQCAFDTRTFIPVGTALVESVTAYGSYWTFNADGTATPTDLALMARYRAAGGPCEGREPGQCSFQTRTFIAAGQGMVESVTAYGRMFDYAIDGAPVAGFGTDLTAIPRYAGACAGKTAGQCVLDTRLLERVDGHVLETVTAYGKVFHYVVNGGAANQEVQPSNQPVETVTRWASGVCGK